MDLARCYLTKKLKKAVKDVAEEEDDLDVLNELPEELYGALENLEIK